MGGIITLTEYQSTILPSLPLTLPFNLQSAGAGINRPILAQPSPTNNLTTIHPELRKLRLLLTCEYGKPKFIKYLLRITPICAEILSENSLNITNFLEYFIENHEVSSSSSFLEDSNTQMDFDIPIQLSINNCLTNILILLGMTYFSSFIHSPEGNDWIRYQHLLTEAHFPRNTSGERSLSESTIALSNARSHELVQRVTDNEIMALMNKPHWIVTLARTLDSIPFPISIHGLESSQLGECRYTLLYGNYAYLELTGYSNQILAGSDITFLQKSNDTNDTSNTKTPIPSLILNSFQTGTKLRLHQINYRANGELFHNFMTLLPLYNMENIYKFMIIVHCDVIKKRNNPQYLHKINLFTETMLPGNIYCDEKDSSFLFSYFYNHDIFTDSH